MKPAEILPKALITAALAVLVFFVIELTAKDARGDGPEIASPASSAYMAIY